MNNSSTPDTDAAFRDGYTFCREDMRPAVEFCANLERERDSAKSLNKTLLDQLEAQAVQLEAMREAIKEAHAALTRLEACEGSPDIDIAGEARFGLHCGVEDRDCQGRYDGAEFGYAQGVERTQEWASNEAKAALSKLQSLLP